jgi:hypothetical protein
MSPSMTDTSRSGPLTPRSIILFWLPLAATWFMMALEGPYILALVARMPEAAHSLAALGVATALAWLIESPIMMLLAAATALVRDRGSYLALRRFAWILNGAVTVGMVILVFPPVFRFIAHSMIGLPPEIARLTHGALAVLIPWPAAIGYRRFYQGVLVRHHLTRRVAYGTVIRLLAMSVTAALIFYALELPGATIGALALLSGVLTEAVASRWMARHVVRSLKESDAVAEGSLLTLRQIASFYYPLALTSMLSMALGPLVTFGLGRGRAPLESLAVWPVINSLGFLFRSGGVAYQEVAIALTSPGTDAALQVRKTGLWLGAASSLLLAAVAFTPLEGVVLERITGLTPRLTDFAVWPLRVLVLLPFLDYVLSLQRSRWILSHRTGTITAATAVEAAGLAVALLAAVGALNMVGAVAGSISLIAGRLAANGFLAVRAGNTTA